MQFHLCSNCLDNDAKPFPIGFMQGGQRDQYQPTHDLCPTCSTALKDGDFRTFSARFTSERTIKARQDAPEKTHATGGRIKDISLYAPGTK
jgi:hypothetical protein